MPDLGPRTTAPNGSMCFLVTEVIAEVGVISFFFPPFPSTGARSSPGSGSPPAKRQIINVYYLLVVHPRPLLTQFGRVYPSLLFLRPPLVPGHTEFVISPCKDASLRRYLPQQEKGVPATPPPPPICSYDLVWHLWNSG